MRKIPQYIVPKDEISWKNIELLSQYINRFGSIKPRKYT
jgi:ribosomal protein S18